MSVSWIAFRGQPTKMVQAARRGRKNIAEGLQVSGTSNTMELKLVSAERASLEERLLDYQDFLRQRELKKGEKDSRKALFIRKLGKEKERPLAKSVAPKSASALSAA